MGLYTPPLTQGVGVSRTDRGAGAAMIRWHSALVVHAGDTLNESGLLRWLGSFSTVRVLIRIHEPASRTWRRVKRETRRVGALRMLDVLAYKALHIARYRQTDAVFYRDLLRQLHERYPAVTPDRVIDVANANEPAVRLALLETPVDFMIARCKQLLIPAIFEAPRKGTYVLHPGICPEFRNAHGGFWALATGRGDLVGTTLLRIDRGVDTGPIYGYFRAAGDLAVTSHLPLQDRTLFDNLDAVQDRLAASLQGSAVPIDVTGRPSAEWGQPWLSAWLRARQVRAE
jgi:hypothetical protein